MKTGCCLGTLLFSGLFVFAAIVLVGAAAVTVVTLTIAAAVVKATFNVAGHRSRR